MKRLVVAVLLFALLAPLSAFAICNNCEPNPGSSTYQSTIKQRPLSWNRRERDPGDGGGGGGGSTPAAPAPHTFGSSSYSYAIPILHLPVTCPLFLVQS